MSSGLSLPLSDIIPISVVISPVAPPGLTFNQALIVGSSNVIPTVGSNSRLRQYNSVAGMLQDGFSTSSSEYLAATLYFSQTPAPSFLWVGRQNLTAISTVTVGSSGGSLNAIGDILTVIQSGASAGQVQVTTVGTNLAATTTASASYGSATITVASATGIATGMTVTGTGIPGATTVSSIAGPVITLSANTTATMLNTPVTFSVTTTASGSSGSNGLTVASATGVAVGATIAGAGIPANTTITLVSGTSITISQNTTQVLSTTSVTISAVTTASAVAGTTSVTVASGSGIVIGQLVAATGIPNGTVVANIVSTTVTLSVATTATLSSTAITFTTTGIVTGVQPVPDSQGNGYSVANNLSTTTTGLGSGATIDITAIGESALQAVAACRSAQPAWYACMFVASATNSDYEAIAAFTEAATPASTFFLTSGDSAVLNNTPNNLFAVLQALNYRRTFMMYSTTQGGAFPNNIYASAAVMGYAMGANNGSANSYFNLMFKAIAGVSPEPLTQTQVNTICGSVNRSSDGLNGNVMVSYNNGSYQFIENGTMCNGGFFDQVLFLDVLVNAMQIAGMNLLISLPSVPLTDNGVVQMKNALSGACAQSVQVGFISPGVWKGVAVGSPPGQILPGASIPAGYFLYAAPVNTLSVGQRAARQFPPITVGVILSEAGQSVVVNLTVQQ